MTSEQDPQYIDAIRRRTVAGAAGALIAAAYAPRAAAQSSTPQPHFPSKPIRIIIPYGAGSSTDIAMRLIAPRMAEKLGQPIVIENRAGGTGIIGSEFVAKSPPDGYTLVAGTVASHAALVPLMPGMPYNVRTDFTPIGLAVVPPAIVAIHPAVPAKNISEFVAWSKQQPAGVSYASSGSGGSGHLATELLKLKTGAHLVHVPYKDASRAVTDLMAGHVQLMVYYATLLPHIRAGKLRALAVLSDKRVAFAPDIPTAAEQGLPISVSGWIGLFGPAGLPAPVRDAIYAVMREALLDPAIQPQMLSSGQEPQPLPPLEFGKFVDAEIARWTEVVRAANIKME
ncbi:MAG: tripartite tricarboxylate transporter substrate binding protein [Ottowia sp.]|uniref:Bug family tripartite tricarboxylate transporter substrate binding protein n=1 Tax=Ottowia sp. TaxID=1898956 RepID=UPI003C741B75